MPPKSPKIAVIVQFGLGGTRVAKLSVTQSFRMIDIARDFKIHFTPEIDDMDIVFVNCITSKAIGSYLTVKEAELTNGATITAVIQVPWQVKIQTTTPIQYRCGCWGYGSGYYKACHVWGPNLTINVNTLKPAFNIGRQTSLDDITSCLRHPDWKHNEGLMAHDDVADLVEFCTVENLWSCTVCSADNEMSMVLCGGCQFWDQFTVAFARRCTCLLKRIECNILETTLTTSM